MNGKDDGLGGKRAWLVQVCGGVVAYIDKIKK